MVAAEIEDMDRQRAEGLLARLTPAQIEVLDRVVLHMTSKEIARELGIAPNTVDQRVKAAWAKLGTSDRASTVRKYAELRTICGQSTYGQTVIDLPSEFPDQPFQDLPDDPAFVVEDSLTGEGFYWGHQPTVLEALDARFGRLGRVGAIVACSVMLAVLGLTVTAIAVTLGNLI